MTKKRSSIFVDAYGLFDIVINSIKLIKVIASQIFNNLYNYNAEHTKDSLEKSRERFNAMASTLKEPETVNAWHRFILTALSIQMFLCISMFVSFYFQDYISAGYSLCALLVASIVFGYKPLILEHKCKYTVTQYLKKLPQSMKCMLLWNYYRELD